MAPRNHKLRHSTNGMARQRSEGHFRALGHSLPMHSAPVPINVRFTRAPCKGGAFQWVRIPPGNCSSRKQPEQSWRSVSYTHLRAHETRHDLVCRLLLEKKKK